ncbi:hypothetical protein N3K66_003076 [Trichothecium roseum]|uniref:Uncharacterized protein n=1 Tax=Trichothecium roseum TaxID=47278 RepID=A0ACC0V5Z5_9HYPO|nr:hypothetical protein N3K66_003076 [Trichothecium roseum]
MADPVFFDLELVYSTAPQGEAELNIVCIHDFGSRPETAWHDDATGKNWINDADFLKELKRPVRVFSFTYNGDTAANLTAAGIAFHAGDLLDCLEQAIADRAAKGPVGPVFILSHGFGGIISKKVLQLAFTTTQWLHVRESIAGLVFSGTPHIEDDSAALFKSIKSMARLHSGNTDLDTKAREFCVSVARLNKAFNTNKPPTIQMLSLWENLPTDLKLVEGGSEEILVVPEESMNCPLVGSKDITVHCTFQDLSRYPSVYNERFQNFMKEFSQMVQASFSDSSYPWLQKLVFHEEDEKDPDSRKHRAKRRHEMTKSHDGDIGPSTASAPPPRMTTREVVEREHAIWDRKKHAEEETSRRHGFMCSLNGWSEPNTGSLIPMPLHTCHWFEKNPIFVNWLNDPVPLNLILTADAGRGKSHLLRAITEEINLKRPLDLILSFYCTPGDENPKIWEYLTWQLLERFLPSWYDIASSFRVRDEKSPPLSMGSFVEIWQNVRRAGHALEIFLLVDGIEQCGEEFANQFFKSIEQLSAPIVAPSPPFSSTTSPAPPDTAPKPRTPTKIRALFTCRPTPAVTRAASHFSCRRWIIPEEEVRLDIASWLDAYCDDIRVQEAADLKHLMDAKNRIKAYSGTYWPYAVHAAGQVSRVLPWYKPFIIPSIPSGLEKHYYNTLLPFLQSVDDKRHIRTLMLIAACQKHQLPLTLAQLSSVLQCLYGEEWECASLGSQIRATCSDFIEVTNTMPLFLVHRSMSTFLGRLFTSEQRYNTLVFICLKYVLQPQFSEPFPHDYDLAALEKYIETKYPFYIYAANTWAFKVANASMEVLPLLREFCSEGCRAQQSWRQALKVSRKGLPGSYKEYSPLLELLHAGAIWALKELLPPPPFPDPGINIQDHEERNKCNPSGSLTFLGILQKRESAFIAVPDWPNSIIGPGLTPLMLSVQSGCLESVRYVLQWRPDIQARTFSGHTALAICFKMRTELHPTQQLRMATVLLESGADPNLCDEDGRTPLHIACATGMIEGVKLLLRHGADVDVSTLRGINSLEYAYEAGELEILQDLLMAGADVDVIWSTRELPLIQAMVDDRILVFRLFLAFADINLKNSEGALPLHAACHSRHHLDYLRLLLEHPSIDVNALSVDQKRQSKRKGHNALLSAVQANRYAVAELLLQKGAIAGEYPQLITCPIMFAVRNGNSAMVELLLMYGASPNIFDLNTRPSSPLSIAVNANRKDIVDILLDYGADANIDSVFRLPGPLSYALFREQPNLEIIRAMLQAKVPQEIDQSPETSNAPLLMAVRGRKANVVRLLLENGADVSLWLRPQRTVSPFHTAVRLGILDICKLLLECEPRLLNFHHDSGQMNQPPLLDACQNNHADLVSFLLDQGADARAMTHHYNTSALLLACERSDASIVETVLKAAPDMVNVADYEGFTPLMRGCARGHVYIIKLLLDAGANVHAQRDRGETCVAALFEKQQRNPFPVLQLLMKRGMDIREGNIMAGHNVLGSAIILGAGVHVVEWLLNHGADPMMAQESPSGTWRTALQVAGFAGRRDCVALLLEPRWGLREHLRDQDWLGLTLFPPFLPNRSTQEVAAAIYVVCEEMRAGTGRDVFTEIITARDISGRHLIDRAIGLFGCEQSFIPQVNTLIHTMLGRIFRRPRNNPQTHQGTLHHINTLLLTATHLPPRPLSKLLTLEMAVPKIYWLDRGAAKSVEASVACDGCREVIVDDVALKCQACMTTRGTCCEFKAASNEFACSHVFVEIELRALGWNSDEVQDCLADLLYYTSLPVEPPPPPPRATEAVREGYQPPPPPPPPPQPDGLQSSLQLATLHAFDLLAIRRPLFSLSLPLSLAAQEAVSRWRHLIGGRRAFVERRNLEVETRSWRRRWDEWRYVRKGLTRAYADEEDVRNLAVLEDARTLFIVVDVDEEGAADSVTVEGTMDRI